KRYKMSKNKSEEEMANELGDEFLNYDGVEGGTSVTETDKGQDLESNQPPSAENEIAEQSEKTDLGHANGNAEKKEENEEGEKKEGEGEEVFEVEAILGHKRNKACIKRSGLKYHIKWKGFTIEESTWENEGDVYAAELLEEYWSKNKDEQPASATSSKRKGTGRKRSAPASTTTSFKESKRSRVSSKPRASRIRPDDDDDSLQASLESWEDQVIAVETVTRDDKTGDLLVYLKWNNGETSRHPAKDVNMRCPQKVCDIDIPFSFG
ncbi:4147_t:CDS:2, partial [Acaulospora colombiana]